jgi:hypothetical protein
MAFVERPEHDPIFGIRRNCEMLWDVVKEALRTISRQVGEGNDDYLVSVVAVSRLSVQGQSLVAVYKRDKIWHVPVGDLLWSKPKSLTFQGLRHEGQTGPARPRSL